MRSLVRGAHGLGWEIFQHIQYDKQFSTGLFCSDYSSYDAFVRPRRESSGLEYLITNIAVKEIAHSVLTEPYITLGRLFMASVPAKYSRQL